MKDRFETRVIFHAIKLQMHLLGQTCCKWKDIPTLARTHGQPASPTRLGKELFVLTPERIENQVQLFSYIPFTGKFGGATGNFNAHYVAYPSKFELHLR